MAASDMNRMGLAAMFCLAIVAAQIPKMLFNVGLAKQVLVIDDCPQACASKTLSSLTLSPFYLLT